VVRLASIAGWGIEALRSIYPLNLGHDVGRNTIRRILADAGLEPAPERSRKTTWKTFLKAHWDAIAAADFFTVEVLTLGALVRYSAFFVMELKARSVHVAGITCQPCEQWMKQVARNLTDATNGFLRGKRHLILDRDPLYTPAFRRMLKDSGVDALLLPPRSPNLNAHAERFVLSIKSECLDRIIPLGEKRLRTAVNELMHHYHSERNHQGFENKLLDARPANTNGKGPVRCNERVGGMLRYYYREAA
jgi:putative transposase